MGWPDIKAATLELPAPVTLLGSTLLFYISRHLGDLIGRLTNFQLPSNNRRWRDIKAATLEMLAPVTLLLVAFV